MKNNEVQCPNCGRILGLYDDEFFCDDLHDDSGNTDIKCMCGVVLPIETDATYAFSIDREALEDATGISHTIKEFPKAIGRNMEKAKQKQSWQKHPGTNTEHFFSDKTPGNNSLCGRAQATTGPFHSVVGGDDFICSLCRKKIEAGR